MHDQQDLQATQQIISLFENSKGQVEDELESMPGIYAVIDEQGNLLKGNNRLACLLMKTNETLIGCQLSTLFMPEAWAVFLSHLANFGANEVKDTKSVEFQSNLRTEAGRHVCYVWHVKLLRAVRPDLPLLYSVLGFDVTELTNTTSEKARMQAELNTAKMVQDTLFPMSNSRFGSSSVSGHYESATECGGDWWYYTKVNNILMLWIGDVTGHGVPAALVTSAVRAAVSVVEDQPLTPSEALKILNKAVTATSSAQKFMTFLVMAVNLTTGDVVYSAAAHEPPFLLPGDVPQITVAELKVLGFRANLPLGTGIGFDYEEQRLKIKPGDRLFLYTDGIFDVQNAAGEAFGRPNFRRLLTAAASANRSPYALVESLKKGLNDYRIDCALVDDVTFLVFQL